MTSAAAKTAVIVDGKRQVHAAASQNGNYQTFCGLDGNDPGHGQLASDVLPGEKITCPDCKAMWLEAKRYRFGDFA